MKTIKRIPMAQAKAELESEMADEELKNSLKASMTELQQALNSQQESLQQEMQAVDTEGVAPMSHAQDVVQRLREDRVTEADQRSLFQSVAPQLDGGLYLVPKVIE